MIKFIWLLLSFVFVQNSYCVSLPNSLSDANITQLIKNIIKDSENDVLEINIGCILQLRSFVENLKSFDDGMWALKMIDASAKVPAGILTFNVAMIGNYDECLAIETTKEDIKPKYCLAVSNGDKKTENLNLLQMVNNGFQKLTEEHNSVEMQNALLPSVGLCIPDKCNIGDIRNTLNLLIPKTSFAITCQTNDDLNKPLDTGAILTIVYFGVFILPMVISTIYDLFRDQTSKPHPLLMAFSTYTNGKKLFAISKRSGEYSCLNGLRFITMLWVILGHQFSSKMMGPVMNTMEAIKYLNTTQSMIITNATYSVDTFLVVTGFLVVYNFMKSMYQGLKFNMIIYYLHRYVRLTPPLIPIILSSIYLIKYLGSGPFYPQTAQYSDVCRSHWWSTLLYIQNYVNLDRMCVSQTWYLNVDWQMYLISPVFLLFLPKRPFIGLSLMLCATIGTMVLAFVATWNYKLQALLSNSHTDIALFYHKYYMVTHTRSVTWFIGGFLGYFLAKMRFQLQQTTLKLPKWFVILTWIIVLAILPVCIFPGLHDLNSVEYHAYSNAIFNTFARPAWGLCIAWIIFACALGYGGVINTILSLPIFQVLNRFTYSIYLLHLTLIYLLVFAEKRPAYFSLFETAYSFWGITALSFGLSIFWVLAFESPVLVLEKYFLGDMVKHEKEKQQIKNDTGVESIVSSQLTVQESIQKKS